MNSSHIKSHSNKEHAKSSSKSSNNSKSERSKKLTRTSTFTTKKKSSTDRKKQKSNEKKHTSNGELQNQIVKQEEQVFVNNNNEGEEEFNSMLTYDIPIDDPSDHKHENGNVPPTNAQEIIETQPNINDKPSKQKTLFSRIFNYTKNSNRTLRHSENSSSTSNLCSSRNKLETRLPKATHHKLLSCDDVRYTSQLPTANWNTFPRSLSSSSISLGTNIPIFKRSSLNVFTSYGLYAREEGKRKDVSQSSIPRLYSKELNSDYRTKDTWPNKRTHKHIIRSKCYRVKKSHQMAYDCNGFNRHRCSLPNFFDPVTDSRGKKS